jgi:hypothetical protein
LRIPVVPAALLVRSSFQYAPRPDRNATLRQLLREYAENKRRRGYRKAHDHVQRELRRKEQEVSLNRVHRLWQDEALQVPRRKGKKRKPPGPSSPTPPVAAHPGHVRSYDFLFDSTANGVRQPREAEDADRGR